MAYAGIEKCLFIGQTFEVEPYQWCEGREIRASEMDGAS